MGNLGEYREHSHLLLHGVRIPAPPPRPQLPSWEPRPKNGTVRSRLFCTFGSVFSEIDIKNGHVLLFKTRKSVASKAPNEERNRERERCIAFLFIEGEETEEKPGNKTSNTQFLVEVLHMSLVNINFFPSHQIFPLTVSSLLNAMLHSPSRDWLGNRLKGVYVKRKLRFALGSTIFDFDPSRPYGRYPFFLGRPGVAAPSCQHEPCRRSRHAAFCSSPPATTQGLPVKTLQPTFSGLLQSSRLIPFTSAWASDVPKEPNKT